jgi:cold shock protein
MHLVIGAPSTYIQLATAFRQMKRTVVLPTRIVRARPRQKNFQTDCIVSAARAMAWAQPDAIGIIMTIGTVKFFNSSKGFGFIAPEDGGKDVFVHATAVEMAGMRELTEGQRVSFDVQPDAKGSKAVNLQSA